MDKFKRVLLLILPVSLNVSAASLEFECKSQMTIRDFDANYPDYSFSGQQGCVDSPESPVALLKLVLDTETLYGEVHEVRCDSQYFSAFESWGQRAMVEALPSIYRFTTPNPLPTASNMFTYDLSRTSNPKATMNRQDWVFDCSMREVEVEKPAF